MDCHIFPTSWLKLRLQVGAVPRIPIKYGEDISTMPIALPISSGVLPLTPAILTCPGVPDIYAPPNAVYATISFVAGITSVYVLNIIDKIPGFVSRGKTGMVQQLNNFCSEFSFLLQVTASESLISSPCASLAVAVFDS